MNKVCLAAVTWNSESTLPAWIESAIQAVNDREDPTDILVIDNASEDSSRELAEAAGIKVVNTGGNLGYAGAVNVAYQVIPADSHILILNPDTRLKGGCVDQMLGELSDPRVGIVVCRIVDSDGATRPSLRRFPTVASAWGQALLGGRRASMIGRLSEQIAVDGYYDQGQDVEWATGAAILVTPDARSTLGSWDPTYFLYSEETEYMMRARQLGIRARYRPSAVVEHAEGDMMSSPGLWRLAIRNRIGLFRRRNSFIKSQLFQAGVITNEALRSARSRVHRAGLLASLRPSRVPAGQFRGIVVLGVPSPGESVESRDWDSVLTVMGRERPLLVVGRRSGRCPETNLNRHDARLIAYPGGTSGRMRAAAVAVARQQVNRLSQWYLMTRPHVLVFDPRLESVATGMARSTLTYVRTKSTVAHIDRDARECEQRLLASAELILHEDLPVSIHQGTAPGGQQHLVEGSIDDRARVLLGLLDAIHAR